ncbi:hypothetical protein YN1_4410 [Nanoarchaeota archaeon]
MMKKVLLLFFLIIILAYLFNLHSQDIYKLYCIYGGGIFFYNSSGQYCIVDGHVFNAIDYYNNLVPSQYSFCAHFGLNLVKENITIDNYTIFYYYCEYPNGTLISPYQIFSEFNQQENVITNNISCSNILQCPNTPWEVEECSNVVYPCFNPPYIPYSLYNGNITLYYQILNNYQEEIGCGTCNGSYSPWYLCPQNYSLEQLYQNFLETCPPPNKVEVNCLGEFTCIYVNQTNSSANQQINQIITENEGINNESTNSNSGYIIPVVITIVVMIVGLIILLFYLK